ncbi:ankyrin repeat domain-containing [Paramuricea clavata]|nr:ankyrin repeat domain-containing [Paramuricea clavata]
MSSNTRKRKYMYFPRRQKSLDYGLTDETDGVNGKRLMLHRLKSIDEKDSTDVADSGLDSKYGVQGSLSDQIKLAAIYDNEPEIIRILSSETNMDDVQRILAKNDERGQPCIFYALESRSHKALVCLLNHVRNTECVIAGNGESVLHVATKMGDIDILRRLLEHDFVVDLVDHVERENGRAPLHLAAKFNHVEIATELLQHGAKLDREDITGKSPLYMAASGGHADMLKVFLEHGRFPFSVLVYFDSYYVY